MLKRVALLALVLAAVSCASAQGKLVLTEDAVHDGLAKADDGVRTWCNDKGAIPAPDVREAACNAVRPALVAALESGAAFNRAVAAQKVDSLGPLVEAVGKLTTELKRLGETGKTLVLELARAIAAAYAEVQK